MPRQIVLASRPSGWLTLKLAIAPHMATWPWFGEQHQGRVQVIGAHIVEHAQVGRWGQVLVRVTLRA